MYCICFWSQLLLNKEQFYITLAGIPLVSVGDMNRFIQQGKTMGEIALLKSFRAWVRGKIG